MRGDVHVRFCERLGGRFPGATRRNIFVRTPKAAQLRCGLRPFLHFNLNLGYRWTESIGTAIGYRILDVDYAEKDFLYDVK